MKTTITSILFAGFLFGTFSTQAQIGNIKKGVGKVKETTKKEAPKPEVKEAESSKTAPGEDFSELEEQKMEWTSTFERLQKKWDQLSYQEYEDKKKEYAVFYEKFSNGYRTANKKEHSDSYTQKLIAEVDGFYFDKVPAEQMEAMKSRVSKSFDETNWSVYPSDRISDIEVAERQVNSARAFLKQPDPELEAFQASLTDQKKKITTYVAEGGLEKRDAEIEKRMVEKRTLHAAGMTDASVNATVNAKIDKNKYGNPVKVVITSTNWEYEHNQYGQPKLKFVKVDIATKKADGKCYYVKGSVAQQHEGGGVYGDKYLNIYYTEGEMNCNNVK